MDEASLHDRLGGDIGVEAILRVLYERVLNDPNVAIVIDLDAMNRTLAADAARVRGLLGSTTRSPTVLFASPEVLDVHLRDALWLCGVAASLVDEVIGALHRGAGTIVE